MATLKKITVKEAIKEECLKHTNFITRFTSDKYNLSLRMKDRIVVVQLLNNKAKLSVVIPFENISEMVVESDEVNDK